MGAHAVSNYRILAGTCIFLNVLISSVIGQMQIPEWDNPPKVVMLSEDKPVGTVIGSLKLKNGDGLMITSESTFVSVTNQQSGPGYITVDIILNTKLDYDSGVSQLNCIFKGINKDVPAGIQLEVKVIVTNVNDEPPYLENQPYSISISEDAATGRSIYTFTSKDLDPGDPPTFSLTAHSQSVDDDYKNKFAVNSATGQLTLMGKLDFETVRFYEYTVIVKDQVGHNNTAQVFITITDVQDTPPFFNGEPFQTKMDENTTVNTKLLQVTATDGDRGAPNDIVFNISSDSCGGLFEIDFKSGWISLKSHADRDTGLVSKNNGVCSLGVKATEDNQHHQSPGSVSTASTSVTITVLDINNNVPTFSSMTYTVQVDENTQAGVPINIQTPISVSDADQGNNAKFDVTITKLNEYFEVTPSQVQSVGEILIRVTNSTILDYEKQHDLILELEARDALGSNTATVTININNVNDNSPIFTNSSYVGSVNESSPSGTPIITITANDSDASSGTDNFNQVTYSLEPSDSSFKINSVTGEVMVDQVQLDRETRSVYYVTVVAKDGGDSKASVVLEIRVLDVNDETPKFVTEDYQTSLDENSTTFSRAITVQATDNDEPNSPNSNVTYKILPLTSPSNLASHFHISIDGQLTVTSGLDFESVFPQGGDGKINLTVEADDQGTPQLSSTVQVIIFLQDINDEDPKCSKTSYSASIPESSNKSSSIIQVGASDRDGTKPNNVFMFSIDQESAGMFIMDSSTGWLTLRDMLDREQKTSYDINVTVNDLGVPSRSGLCQIVLTVNDINDSPPVFYQKQVAVKAIENKPGQIFPVSAHDPDSNHSLFYNISWQDCTAQDPKGQTTDPSVLQDWVTINSTNGTVTTTDKLNRETIESFTLVIQVTDLNTVSGSATDKMTLSVHVDDINDEHPEFSATKYDGEIQENMPVGSQVLISGAISVTDKDKGQNSEFAISLISHSEVFTVVPDKATGQAQLLLQVKNSTYLDFETVPYLLVEIMATETATQQKFTGTTKVNITINNINDNMPEFIGAPFSGSVPENELPGTLVTTVTAHDADLNEFGKITFSLLNSQTEFRIDPSSGKVFTTISLNRELQDTYTLSVRASDIGNFASTTQLVITVSDVNDNSPIFTTNGISRTISENDASFIPFLLVQAEDKDTGNNGLIEYSLLSFNPSNVSSNFIINNSTSEITLSSKLDYEALFPLSKGVITITIQAKDSGKNPNTNTTTVSITVEDYNDNSPVFLQLKKKVQVPENATGKVIVNVSATDNDAGPGNNKVGYMIDTLSASTFTINNSTGDISLSGKLDYEAVTSYSIIVTAFDNGSPMVTSTCVVQIDVTDVNDVNPQFYQKQISNSTLENKNINYLCSAKDDDTHHELFYDVDWKLSSGRNGQGVIIASKELKTWIDIDHNTGEVMSLKPLDREQISEFTLQITVVDVKAEVNKPQTDTATITITVIDENDEAPNFIGGRSYTASIQENMPAGSDIRFDNHATLDIFDADEGVNSKFSVQLLTNNNTFSINPTTGASKETFTISVTDSSALDYENTTFFILEVLAVDDNDVSKMDSATVTVSIINENDNIPQFSGSPPYTASLLENSTDGTFVYNVDATDDDSGIFGIVEYFIEDKFKTFDIDNTTGKVFLLHGDLDRENIPEYTVTVIAKDKGNFRATTQLVISVTDVNDKVPNFANNPYTLTFDEEVKLILPSFSVLATDDDDPSSPNSKVNYSLTNAKGKPYSFFSIDPASGLLTLSSPINCEDLYKACDGTLTLEVQAIDQGTPSNSNVTTIEITVMDTNDNPPEFIPKSYAASVKEDALPNKPVLTVTATDKDATTKNNQVSYSLDTLSNKTFSIDANGTITVKDKLDRETTPHYTIIVTALDNGMPIQTSTASVEIDVEDVNDKAPTFSWSSKSVTKQENTNDLIAQNVANDPDLDKDLIYSIVWEDSSGMDGAGRYIPGTSLKNYILINKTTGEVFPVGELDRERTQRFQLTLFVKDQNGTTPQNDTAILTIIVQDENDAAPTFQGGDHFTGTIQENMPKDSEVKMINISALIISDGDSGNNSMYNIALDDISVFKISPSNGDGNTTCVISVVDPLQLDYETRQSFTLKVIAIESNTADRFNNTATVTVLIENTDDEIPQFSKPLFEVFIHENSDNGDSVTTMSATDKDLGEFGIVEYYIDGPETWFTIDNKTGLVKVNTTLNRERKDSYTVTVKARDIKNYEGSTQLTVRVTDENDMAPVFQETSYAAEVVENQDFFKVPLIVKATDDDEPNTINSQISYSITKVPPTFSPGSLYINDKTGEINFTSPAPDYEVIIANHVQDGIFQIEVTATDGGTPSQSSSVMVNVTVKDSNDKSPKFQPSNYNENVLENSAEGVSIVTVTASDGDGTSPNNEFYFVIQSGSHDKFQINSSTGEITVGVGASLDREGTDKDGFKLTVLAIDKGTPAQTGTATVTIAVKDVNDSPPTISPTNGLFYVYENDSVSTQITSFNASDPDENPELSFDVLWGLSHAYDEKEKETDQNLIKAWLKIDPVSGVITVKSEMDRETVEQMVLKVIVEDKNASSNLPQVVTATVTVSILDVNDNPPVISSLGDTLNLNISEGTKVNTEVATLTATDADKGQTTKFSLENTNSNFTISESGKLKLIGKLDRETQPELSFIVVATDTGSPPMSSNITVKIIVLDINDSDPQFQGTNFTFYVRENSDNTTHVATIKADDDDDGDNKNVTFEFKDISPFYINPITGDISVSGELDRESVPTHILTVIAADNPSLESRRRASTQITIIIEDVNDNYPIFKQTEYTGRISEERTDGEIVTITPSSISATDKDVGANAHITYLIMDADYFDINPVTGDVTVKGSILDKSAEYSYVVNATDGGSPALWTTVNLTITVIDANNHAPEFVNIQPISIPECAQHDESVYKFIAKDNDTDQTTNAKIQYKLFDAAGSNDSRLFRLDPDSGQLFTAKGDPLVPLFNHDIRPELKIEIMAVDNGDPQKSSDKVSLTIKVTDFNNNDPEFDQKPITFHVTEEQEGLIVGTVKAFDKDENTQLTYEISDGDLDYFYIVTDPDPDKGGIIKVNKSLDREMLDKFVIKVTAVDVTQQVQDALCGNIKPNNNRRSQAKEVVIMVDDINDNPPVFTKKSLAIGFLSSTEFGKILTFLQNFVHDNDTFPNNVHKFYQHGEAIPDEELSKTWSTTIMPDPIKVDLNGTLSTNYKFSIGSSGYFNMKILVNDTAGNDTINMKIYVVGESQVVHLTLWQTEDNLRKVQDEITKQLSQTGYQFIPDNILPAYGEDGKVDNSKSVLVTHAIDADGNIVTGKKLISILDESPVTTGVQNNFKISKTESGEDVGKMVNDNTEERMRYILIAIIAVIAATFVITLGLLLHNIRKFKRKLKAATIEVHGLDQMKRDSFPGLDNHDIKSANPLFMMNNIGFDGNNDYDADDNDTLSQNSQNSLDQNAVVSRDHGTKAKPAIDEQEVTLDMYGNDDVGAHSSGLYSDLDFSSPEPLQDNMVSPTDEKTWSFNETSDEKDIQQTLDLNNFEFTEI